MLSFLNLFKGFRRDGGVRIAGLNRLGVSAMIGCGCFIGLALYGWGLSGLAALKYLGLLVGLLLGLMLMSVLVLVATKLLVRALRWTFGRLRKILSFSRSQ